VRIEGQVIIIQGTHTVSHGLHRVRALIPHCLVGLGVDRGTSHHHSGSSGCLSPRLIQNNDLVLHRGDVGLMSGHERIRASPAQSVLNTVELVLLVPPLLVHHRHALWHCQEYTPRLRLSSPMIASGVARGGAGTDLPMPVRHGSPRGEERTRGSHAPPAIGPAKPPRSSVSVGPGQETPCDPCRASRIPTPAVHVTRSSSFAAIDAQLRLQQIPRCTSPQQESY
jgi:hypothetical protein